MEQPRVCPKCGGKAPFAKKWEMKGRVQKAGPTGTGRQGDTNKSNVLIVKLYRCRKCGKSFRTHEQQTRENQK